MFVTPEDLERVASTQQFSGVVRVETPEAGTIEFASGYRDRANEQPNDLTTRFAIASGTKTFTALTIMALVELGALTLDTTLRSVVLDDLPHVPESVTIDHLLSHRSGVGDYLDESSEGGVDDHILAPYSADTFEMARDYLPLLNAHRQQSVPGARFDYNNGAM